jgi:hypothetical protein
MPCKIHPATLTRPTLLPEQLNPVNHHTEYSREPQSRWQGSTDSPVAIVLYRFERTSRKDDVGSNEGWPDPTSETNCNLAFLLRHAGLAVTAVPEPAQRVKCSDVNGYGTSGILYFTNAIHHSLSIGKHPLREDIDEAAHLLKPQLLDRKVVAVAGKEALKVVNKALNLSERPDEEEGSRMTWGNIDVFALPHPSFRGDRNAERHLTEWARFGKRVPARLPEWHGRKYREWSNKYLRQQL